MSLANFTDLKASVASWLHRDDLVDNIPDFITLAESRFNRNLRLRQQMTTTALATVADTATVALPNDWLQFHRLRLTSPDRGLDFLPSREFAFKYRVADAGSPRNYTIEGASLVLGPKPDAVYSIDTVYFAAIPALTVGSPTNWLLTAHPALYLFATLSESAPFIGKDERIPTWESKYAAALEAAMHADQKARASGSGLRIRAR